MGVVLAVLLAIVSISHSTEVKLPNSFSIDLIHRDSPLSPFYNSSMNQSEALRIAAMRSISRANTVFNLANTTAYGIKSQAPVIPIEGDYLMKFSVGTPPVDSFGLIDTASELIWVQCKPCEDCYKQIHPFFDPIKSSTYRTVSCQTDTCGLVEIHACGAEDVCRYELHYADESMSVGVLGRDTISFGPLNFRRIISPNTLFGCGHVNTGIFKTASTGIVGLGQGPLSLISQLGDQIGHKFSYCFVPWGSKIPSKIKFGWEATIYGYENVSVPLMDKASSYYHLRLKEIYIGKDAVQPGKTSDIVIDSGTVLTFLETSLYESFEAAVIEAYGDDREPISNPPTPFKLCYLDGTTLDIPNITFSFFGAKKGLQLNKFNVFLRFNNLLCLMMAPTKGYSVFGSIAQANFKVLYDLQAKRVSFTPMDCTKEY